MNGLPGHYRAMAGYNRWMNQRLYALCATLSDERRRRETGAYFGSIHGTLNHLLWADRAWMLRFTGDESRYLSRDGDGGVIRHRPYGADLYPDFAVLRRERERTDADIEDWVSGLDPARLNAVLAYRNAAGQSFEHPLWWALSHLFNHQTHHRGQLTTLLMQQGQDPGVTDLVAWLRQPGSG